MNRKSSIVVRSLVAMTFASGPVISADAGLIKIVHLDCAQWHARLARLAYRKEHPLPRQTHRFAAHHHRPRIHFVCDCKDGSVGDADTAAVATPDDVGVGGGVNALLGGGASSAGDQSLLSSPGGSSGQTNSGASSNASSESGSGGSGSAADSNSFPSLLASRPSGLLNPAYWPAKRISFIPHLPSGPSQPLVSPPGRSASAPEPSTWLLVGLGAAAVLGLKRRRAGPATEANGLPGARRSTQPA
jgi:hypothetical protein